MRERGSGTLLAIGVGAVLIVGGLVGTALATVIAATHRADAAADLAALSAARLLVEGEEEACAKARAVAKANAAELETCQTANLTVEIVVRARTGRLLGTSITVRGRARAGPSGFRQEETAALNGLPGANRIALEKWQPAGREHSRGLPWPRPANTNGEVRHANRIALEKWQPPPGGSTAGGCPGHDPRTQTARSGMQTELLWKSGSPRRAGAQPGAALATTREHKRRGQACKPNCSGKVAAPAGGESGGCPGHDPRTGRTGTSGGGVAAEMPVPPWRSFETPIGNGTSSVTHHMLRRHLRLRRVTETVRRAAE